MCLKLTQVSTNRTVLVNMSKIQYMITNESPEGTLIYLDGDADNYIVVSESIDEIQDIIKKAEEN